MYQDELHLKVANEFGGDPPSNNGLLHQVLVASIFTTLATETRVLDPAESVFGKLVSNYVAGIWLDVEKQGKWLIIAG